MGIKKWSIQIYSEMLRTYINGFQFLEFQVSDTTESEKTYQIEDIRILLLEHPDTGFHTPF